MMTTVPWHLESSLGAHDRADRQVPAPGDLRRCFTDDVADVLPSPDAPVPDRSA